MSEAQNPGLLNNEFFKIHFKHLATGEIVKFSGWVQTFSDSFSSNWNEQTVYGRMDPLATFQGTSRTISMGFDVVAKGASEAKANLAQINRLIEFLYPVYNGSERSNQNTLKAAPLLGLRWTNLVANSTTGGELIGWIDGIDYSPDITQGGFIDFATREQSRTPLRELSGREADPDFDNPDASGTEEIITFKERKGFIPKKVSLSISFHVVHTHLMGWTPTKIFGNSTIDYKFPNNQSLVHGKFTQTVTTITDQAGDVTQTAIDGPLAAANQTDVLGSGDS